MRRNHGTRSNVRQFIALPLLLLASVTPGRAHAADPATSIKIACTTNLYPMLFENKLEDIEKNTGIHVTFSNDVKKPNGSALYMQMLLKGEADLTIVAGVFQDWKDDVGRDQDAKYRSFLSQLTYRLIGREHFVVGVDAKAQVTALTEKQLAGILAGDIHSWKQVGGQDLPVVLVRLKNTNARDRYTKKTLLGGKDFRQDAHSFDNYPDAVAFVERTPGSMVLLGDGQQSIFKGLSFPKLPSLGRPILSVTIGKPSETIQKLETYLTRMQQGGRH